MALFYKASSFVSSLRLMKSAFQSPPGPDTQTPKALSHLIHKVLQRVGVIFNAPSKPPPPSTVSLKTSMHTYDDTQTEMQTCSYAHENVHACALAGCLRWTHTLGRCLQHINCQSCRPVYFYCLKTASIHYPKIFLSVLVLFFLFCFFSYMPWGHPLMSLTLRKHGSD